MVAQTTGAIIIPCIGPPCATSLFFPYIVMAIASTLAALVTRLLPDEPWETSEWQAEIARD